MPLDPVPSWMWQEQIADLGYTYRKPPEHVLSNHLSGLALDINVPPLSLEVTMSQYGSSFAIPPEFASFLQRVERTARAPKIGTEAYFATLDVQEGDRVRLTELRPRSDYFRGEQRRKPDAAVLEGVVLGVKRKPARPSQLRIKGFDHTGGNAGGQHVWFPVDAYHIEVLHRVFRMTDEDRVLIAVTGDTESYWRSLSDSERARRREQYAPRVAKVKRALGVDTEAAQGRGLL